MEMIMEAEAPKPLVNPDRVDGGIAARRLIEEAIALTKDAPEVFYDHFWEIMRDEAIARVGIPLRHEQFIRPMSDTDAGFFQHRRIPKTYGVPYCNRTVGQTQKLDPEFLKFIAKNPNAFQKELVRFLARPRRSQF